MRKAILLPLILLFSDCAKSTTDPVPELALLGLTFLQYAYAGSTSGAAAYLYSQETGGITETGSIAGINCSKMLTRHPALPVLYCLGTSGGADVVNVLSVYRDSFSVVQTLTLADSTFGDIRVQPSGAYAVISHAANNNVYVYAVDAFSGMLSFASSTAADTGGAAMGFSHGGAYLYARRSGTTVHEFSLSGGVLTQAGTPFGPGTNTWIFVESPDGRYMYSTTGTTSAFRFNIADGPASNFNGAAMNLGFSASGFTFHRDGFLQSGRMVVYGHSSGLIGTLAYDSSSGNLTETFSLAGVSQGLPILAPGERHVLTTSGSTYEIYSLAENGSLARIAGSPFSTQAANLTPFVFIPFLK